MNNQEANNQSAMIEDLMAQNAEEIKGGQTREHILLATPSATNGKKKKTSSGGGGDWNGDGTVSGSDY